MRPLAALVLAGVLVLALPSTARAQSGAVPTWVIGLTTKVVVRVIEFVSCVEEDLRAQADRRRRAQPPLLAPPLDAIASGGTTTAPAEAPLPSRPRSPR